MVAFRLDIDLTSQLREDLIRKIRCSFRLKQIYGALVQLNISRCAVLIDPRHSNAYDTENLIRRSTSFRKRTLLSSCLTQTILIETVFLFYTMIRYLLNLCPNLRTTYSIAR